MEVGSRVLGVAGVADPSDGLPLLHPGAHGEAGSDAPSHAVVGSEGVVVEMDVVGTPAVGVTDGHRTALR